MKKHIIQRILAFGILGIFIVVTSILTILFDRTNDIKPNSDTIINLYGETHGIEKYYDVELSEWKKYYAQGMRNLFVELPYYTAEYLNLWMKASDDSIIDAIFEDIKGSLSANKHYRNFFVTIKTKYPETIFYGTDVGHQYDTTGARYLEYLKDNGLEDSENYKLASECIEQGKTYRAEGSNNGISAFRETCMVNNFINAYTRCGGGRIMGIYGSYHTVLTNSNLMGGRLLEHYGPIISSVSIVNQLLSPKPFAFGFSYVGLAFLLMLFIPNIIWTRKKPMGYQEYAATENKVLGIFERIGEISVTCLCLIFTDFNPRIINLYGSIQFPMRIFFLIIAIVLMIFYEIYWVRYFMSKRTMNDFYSSFLGFPVAGATLPVMAFLLLGIYGNNIALIIASVILGIGHIGIHAKHAAEASQM